MSASADLLPSFCQCCKGQGHVQGNDDSVKDVDECESQHVVDPKDRAACDFV